MATLRAATTHQTPSTQFLPNLPMREGRGGRKSRTKFVQNFNVLFGAQSKLHNLTQLERKTSAILETPWDIKVHDSLTTTGLT